MSLATRCTSCETVFRVVQDQLRVSEGWVRCGRCDAVFNGLECLFDLDRAGLHDASAPAAHAPAPAPEAADLEWLAAPAAPSGRYAEADADAIADPHLIHEPADATAAENAAQFAPEPERWRARESAPQTPLSGAVAPAPAPAPAPAFGAALASALVTADTSASAPTPAPTPKFLHVAKRRARWHATPVRVALLALGAALLVGVAGQALHHYRDLVAARWPQTLPLLTPWCQLTGCVIAPLRRIDAVAVESTALTRTAVADTFTLAVGLRNRGALRVALPSLDVTLTDSDGHLVARRALAPTDFPAAAPTLAAGAETLLNITLATGSPRVSGYTVEVFYP